MSLWKMEVWTTAFYGLQFVTEKVLYYLSIPPLCRHLKKEKNENHYFLFLNNEHIRNFSHNKHGAYSREHYFVSDTLWQASRNRIHEFSVLLSENWVQWSPVLNCRWITKKKIQQPHACPLTRPVGRTSEFSDLFSEDWVQWPNKLSKIIFWRGGSIVRVKCERVRRKS